MATKKTEAKTVTIKQIGSPIRRKGDQRATLVYRRDESATSDGAATPDSEEDVA